MSVWPLPPKERSSEFENIVGKSPQTSTWTNEGLHNPAIAVFLIHFVWAFVTHLYRFNAVHNAKNDFANQNSPRSASAWHTFHTTATTSQLWRWSLPSVLWVILCPHSVSSDAFRFVWLHIMTKLSGLWYISIAKTATTGKRWPTVWIGQATYDWKIK